MYEASGSPKSFVARHSISSTITSTCRESQAGKSYECNAIWSVWKFFERGSEPGTEGRARGGRDIIYGKRRRGRYGMVVREWFDPTTVPRQREHRWPRFTHRAGLRLLCARYNYCAPFWKLESVQKTNSKRERSLERRIKQCTKRFNA